MTVSTGSSNSTHLLHRPVVLLNIAGRGKLGPKYYRPFHVSKHIDDIAYKLKLPQGTKLHDMFHVALLKTFHAPPP
jgi:hypothetical protein